MALAALYDATAPLVNGLALRILGDQEAAKEVTADVYLHVWRQALRYDPGRGAPLSWLLTLARSRAIDRLRGGSTQRRQTEPLSKAFGVPSAAPGPEETSAAAERRRVVQGALARLAAEQRRAIELAYYGGLSHSEMPPRPGLRERLLAEACGAGRAEAPLHFLTAQEGAWTEIGPGILRRDLASDPANGSAYLARLAPGAEVPRHDHAIIEHCYVIDGDLHVAGRHLARGDYHRAARGTMHGGLYSERGCLLLVVEARA